MNRQPARLWNLFPAREGCWRVPFRASATLGLCLGLSITGSALAAGPRPRTLVPPQGSTAKPPVQRVVNATYSADENVAGSPTLALAMASAKDGPVPANGVRFDPFVRPVQEVVPQQPPTPTEAGAQPGGSGLLGNQQLPSDLQQALTPQAPASDGSAANPSISAPISGTGASPERIAEAAGPAATGVAGGAQTQFLGTSDAGDLLTRADSALGVERQFRSPIATDIRIRGYRLGQVQTYADDQFWFPARNDLDTFLSKIDSGLIQDVIILKGPYTARFGPGFAFIDIATAATPRYKEGFEAHGRTASIYRDNGQQFYARQSIFAGAENWGTRVSYGQRTGNDYLDGAGVEIPGSYNARDVEFAYGFDWGNNQNLEFGYIRLDQTDVEFPGQVFDTRWLGTDGYRLKYTLDNQNYFDKLEVISYYNRTVFTGDAQNASKRRQIPELNEIGFTGFTDGDLSVFGDQLAITWGRPGEQQWIVGVDVRVLSQQINEFDRLFDVPCDLNYPVPRTNMVDAGIFVENVNPLTEYFTVKMGGRFDTLYFNVPNAPPFFESSCDCGDLNVVAESLGVDKGALSRYYQLGAGYINGELKATDELTFLGGFGFAMRPPTPTELYAINPFLAILQQGFTTVQGNPRLSPEKLHQMDIGFRGDYGWYRVGAAGFYSWINDYITYEALGDSQGKIPLPLTNALNVRFVNTSLATLWGTEAYAEFDVTDTITPFATLTYVQGWDQSRGDRAANIFVNGVPLPNPASEALPGIAPLESRVGVRLHEAGKRPTYGVELSARMVDGQDLVAASLLEQPTGGFTVFDMRAYWQAREGVLLTAGMENVFDRFYREHLDLRTGRGVFQMGRSTYVGLELRY